MAEGEEPKLIGVRDHKADSDAEDPDAFSHAGAAVGEEKLDDILFTIERTKYGKISATQAYLRATASVNFFTCQQLCDIIDACTFEEERIGSLNVLARRIVDIENLDIVLAKLSSEKELAEYCKAFKIDPETIGTLSAGASKAGSAAAAAAAASGDEAEAATTTEGGTDAPEGDALPPTPPETAAAATDKTDADKKSKKKKKKRRRENEESQGVSRRFIDIYCTDPEKHGDGLKAYTSYQVTCVPYIDTFRTGGATVRRRFRDFVWLHNNLTFYHPGVIICELPEKQMKGRFNPEFVEERRRALERYLQRAASHKELAFDYHLQQFLESDEDTWAGIVKEGESQLKADKKAARKERSSMIGGAKDKNAPKFDKHIDMFDLTRAYNDNLSDKLTNLKKHAKLLSGQHAAMAQNVIKMGTHLSELCDMEQDEVFVDVLRDISNHFVSSLSTVYCLLGETERVQLQEPIKEYVGLTEGVKEVMKNRMGALKEYMKSATGVDNSKQKLSKLRDDFEKKVAKKGDDEKGWAKVQKEEEVLKGLEEVLDAKKKEFERISEQFFSEMKRFQDDRIMDFRDIFLEYVKSHIEASKRMEACWKQVIPHVKALPRWTTAKSAPAQKAAEEASAPADPQVTAAEE